MKMKYFILACLFLGMLMLVGCKEDEMIIEAEVSSETSETEEPVTEIQADTIYVYVCGKVKCPGVYQVAADARVCDALELAGGVLADGNAEVLMQAGHMADGETIYVPGIEEEVLATGKKQDGRVNINTASLEELMTLSGIGESKAELIVNYREEHGAFQAIENLMDIPGIKEGVFNKIKEKIKV